MSDHRPIGIFDSGLGGLTVAKQIHRLLPQESTIYIGDTARVPYGNRSPETVIQFSRESVQTLLDFDVKAIVIACGTASSLALTKLQQTYRKLPIIGVIDSAAIEAIQATHSRHIGIIGTKATIGSQSFETSIKNRQPDITTHAQSCPLFVPIIEEGIIAGHPILAAAIDHYLRKLKQTSIDTLILGCTHYPIISRQLSVYLPQVKLINPGKSVALELKQLLSQKNLENPKTPVSHKYYVTDINTNFEKTAAIFMGQTISIKKIIL